MKFESHQTNNTGFYQEYKNRQTNNSEILKKLKVFKNLSPIKPHLA